MASPYVVPHQAAVELRPERVALTMVLNSRQRRLQPATRPTRQRVRSRHSPSPRHLTTQASRTLGGLQLINCHWCIRPYIVWCQTYLRAESSQRVQDLESMRRRQEWVLAGVLQPAVEDEAEEAALQPCADRVRVHNLCNLPSIEHSGSNPGKNVRM